MRREYKLTWVDTLLLGALSACAGAVIGATFAQDAGQLQGCEAACSQLMGPSAVAEVFSHGDRIECACATADYDVYRFPYGPQQGHGSP